MVKLLIFLILLIPSFCVPSVALVCATTKSQNYQRVADSLKKMNQEFTLFELSTLSVFPAAELETFRQGAVIRLVEKGIKESYITVSEGDFWYDYLSLQGTLLLFGDILGEEGVYTGRFPDYVGFMNRRKNFNLSLLNGEKNDLITDKMRIFLNFDGQAEVIEPFSNAGIDVILSTEKKDIFGIKKQSCSYKTAYFSFVPTSISEEKIWDSLFKKSMEWMLGSSIAVDMKAKDFPLLALDGTESSLFSEILKQEKEIFILEFMATWCTYCATQLPIMKSLHQKYANSSSFLFVDYKESLQTVQDYLEKNPEILWPVAISEHGLGEKLWGVKSLPALFILDKSRTVRMIHRGNVDEKTLEIDIKALIRREKFINLYK